MIVLNQYFTANNVNDFAFYRIPKALITEPCYRSVPIDAKLLYGLLLDRMCLSMRNGWLDEQGRVFLYYTIASVQEDLRCGKEKACKLFKELEKADLIERKRQGQGKPSRIYVKRFYQKSEKQAQGSRIIEFPEVRESNPNKTEGNRYGGQ